jgi:hypothetical protein
MGQSNPPIFVMGQRDTSKFAPTSPALTMTALAADMANENASISLFKKRRIAKKRRISSAKNGG